MADIEDMKDEEIYAYLMHRLIDPTGESVDRVRYATFTTAEPVQWKAAIMPPEGVDDGDGMVRGVVQSLVITHSSKKN